MNLYKKYILPIRLNRGMQKDQHKKYRPSVIKNSVGNVLEIGFGSGLNLPYYKNISKLYALEPSRELFGLAKGRVDDFEFPFEYICATAENIPLEDKSIDTVVSTWSMCSIPVVQDALREIKRVLKDDGRFVFIEHGISPEKSVAVMQKIFTPVSKTFAGGCRLDRDIEGLIKSAGFEFVSLDKFKSKNLDFTYSGIAKKLAKYLKY